MCVRVKQFKSSAVIIAIVYNMISKLHCLIYLLTIEICICDFINSLCLLENKRTLDFTRSKSNLCKIVIPLLIITDFQCCDDMIFYIRTMIKFSAVGRNFELWIFESTITFKTSQKLNIREAAILTLAVPPKSELTIC